MDFFNIIIIICSICCIIYVIHTLKEPLAPTRQHRQKTTERRPIIDAAHATDGRAVLPCTITFSTSVDANGKKQYCVHDDITPKRCAKTAQAAIIQSNEAPRHGRCARIMWGFGCDKGHLCGLQQAGPNLISYATADKLATQLCNITTRLLC